MSAAVFFGLRALSQTLTAQEALSGVFGSISLATWIFLLVCAKEALRRAIEDICLCEGCANAWQVPQLILNYKTGSADGISLAFLFVWLIGDITNLSGKHATVHEDFRPSMYHSFSD